MASVRIGIAAIALLGLFSSLAAQEPPFRGAAAPGAGNSLVPVFIILGLAAYYWCIRIIGWAFKRLFEKGQSRWPIPVVVLAMYILSGLSADWLHIKNVIGALFLAVIPCSAVSLLYLGIINVADIVSEEREERRRRAAMKEEWKRRERFL